MDAKHTLGEPRVLISRKALLHNAAVLRRRLGPGTGLCAVVKADAYGHGAGVVADTLCNCALDDQPSPANSLAVASLDEAAALAAITDVRVSVLVLRPLENAFVGRQRGKIEEAVRRGWAMTVCSPAAAEDVARIAGAAGRRANVQVMVDTGLARGGVAPDHLPRVLQKIDARPALRLTGLYTHFAGSEDVAGGFTRVQLDRFLGAAAGPAAGRVARHAANSAAVFFHPAAHLDLVRPGLALYGIDPTGRPHLDRPLRPVMKWVAPLVGITDVPAGATVGYGRAWAAGRPTRVGLVPVGYADGYPRCFSGPPGRAVVVVHGRPAPVIGRVSMDLTTIDLTDVPHAALGDDVTLLDDDPLSPASVYQLASWADTIPYEIFCGIGPRVHRVGTDEEDAGDESGRAVGPTSAGEPRG